jgi:hypothetical protein
MTHHSRLDRAWQVRESDVLRCMASVLDQKMAPETTQIGR